MTVQLQAAYGMACVSDNGGKGIVSGAIWQPAGCVVS